MIEEDLHVVLGEVISSSLLSFEAQKSGMNLWALK